MSKGSSAELESALLAARGEFLAFVRSRIADPELAEDVLQDALLRALASIDGLRDDDRLVPWFYRILRNAIVDAYRRRATREQHSLRLPPELDLAEEPDIEDQRTLCDCFRAIVPTLKHEYAEVLEAELAEEPSPQLARRLAITPGNLKVRRHRARRALRERLELTCRVCSTHGCLDCTCDEGTSRSAAAGAL